MGVDIMKFLENKTEKIVNGIYSGGIIYFIGYCLMQFATLSTASSQGGHYITVGIFYIGNLLKPIGILVILKSLCDTLYKILKTLDKYNNEES